MKNLSGKLLIETYIKAIELDLSKEFIDLLSIEIDKRFTKKLRTYKLRTKYKVSYPIKG